MQKYFENVGFDFDSFQRILDLYRELFPFEKWEMTSEFLVQAKNHYDKLHEFNILVRTMSTAYQEFVNINKESSFFNFLKDMENNLWNKGSHPGIKGWQIVAISNEVVDLAFNSKDQKTCHRSHLFRYAEIKHYFLYRTMVLNHNISLEEFAELFWLMDRTVVSLPKMNARFDIFKYKGREEEWAAFVRNNAISITGTQFYQTTSGGYTEEPLKMLRSCPFTKSQIATLLQVNGH